MKKTFLFLSMAVATTMLSCDGGTSETEGFIDYVSIQPDPNGGYGGNRSWALANLDGDVIELPENLQYPTASVNGIFAAKDAEQRKWFFYTTEKEPKQIGEGWYHVGAFTGKYAPVTTEEGSISYVDREGKVAFDVVAHNAGNFFCGRALIMASNLYGYIDETGELVIPAEYVKASRFNEGYAVVWKDNDEWAVIDTEGKEVVSDTRDHSWPNEDTPRMVQDGYLIAAMPGGKSYIFYNVKEPDKTVQQDWGKRVRVFSLVYDGWCFTTEGSNTFGLYNPTTGETSTCSNNPAGELRARELRQFHDVTSDYLIENLFTPAVKGYGKKVAASRDGKMYLVSPSGSKTEAPIFMSELGDLDFINEMVMESNTAY